MTTRVSYRSFESRDFPCFEIDYCDRTAAVERDIQNRSVISDVDAFWGAAHADSADDLIGRSRDDGDFIRRTHCDVETIAARVDCDVVYGLRTIGKERNFSA